MKPAVVRVTVDVERNVVQSYLKTNGLCLWASIIESMCELCLLLKALFSIPCLYETHKPKIGDIEATVFTFLCRECFGINVHLFLNIK